MPLQVVPFNKVPKDARFRYDGDEFRKRSDKTAWEIRDCEEYKGWAFTGDELCSVQMDTSPKTRRMSLGAHCQ